MDYEVYLSSSHLSGNELKYIHRAFDENKLATFGSNIIDFEKEIQKYLKTNKEVLAVNSGTSAIHLALILLGVEAGDEVICQSLSFCASANPIIYLGAIPIFVDSEEETWNICPKLLRLAIEDRIAKGKKPKAIIGVHLYGMPFKVKEIIEISEEFNIPLLEDAAEALGSTYNGQACGTFGTFGVLSYNGNKIITTGGGGSLICNTIEVKNRALHLATQAKEDEPFYHHLEVGYNYRMNNLNAAIGLAQIEVLAQYSEKRKSNLRFYTQFFQNINGVSVIESPSTNIQSNCWLNQIVIDKEKTDLTPIKVKEQLMDFKIESKLIWKPLHLQPVFKDYPFYSYSHSAEKLFNTGLSLPSGSNLSREDFNKISEAFKIIFS